MRDTLIIVPMKDPLRAKSRLADTLSPLARARLAERFYRRTLVFLAPLAPRVGADVAVVTGSARCRAIAAEFGMPSIDEGQVETLSDAVGRAAAWAAERGYSRICVIPADLAAPDGADLETLLAMDAPLVVCPSADRGTNALLVSPPTAIPFRYGPASAARHLAEGEAAGIVGVLLPLESLSLDVDTSACLARARALAPDLEVAP